MNDNEVMTAPRSVGGEGFFFFSFFFLIVDMKENSARAIWKDPEQREKEVHWTWPAD
jgi:hypothetical protein